MSQQQSKRPWVRIILLVLAGGLLVLAGLSLHGACRMRSLVRELEKPLAEVAVDLSSPNRYVVTLPPVRPYFHGLGLKIRLRTTEKEPARLEQLFKGFKGAGIIAEPEGKLIQAFELTDSDILGDIPQGDADGFFTVLILEPIREYKSDQSQLTLSVEEPAPGLGGIERTLIVGYNLCGMEYAAFGLYSVFAAILILAGLGIAVPVVLSLCRQARARVCVEKE